MATYITDFYGRNLYIIESSRFLEYGSRRVIYKIESDCVREFSGIVKYKFRGEDILDFAGTVLYRFDGYTFKDFYGRVLYKIGSDEIRNFTGTIIYKINGYLSRSELMGVIAILLA